MKKILFILGLLTFNTALAEWGAIVEDDLFYGKKAFAAGELGSSNILFINCNKDGELQMSLLEKANNPSDITAAAKLLVKIDDNAIYHLDGTFGRRNNDFIEIANKDKESIKKIIFELKDAKNKFMVGYALGDNKESLSGSVQGSTKAMNDIIQACDIK